MLSDTFKDYNILTLNAQCPRRVEKGRNGQVYASASFYLTFDLKSFVQSYGNMNKRLVVGARKQPHLFLS